MNARYYFEIQDNGLKLALLSFKIISIPIHILTIMKVILILQYPTKSKEMNYII